MVNTTIICTNPIRLHSQPLSDVLLSCSHLDQQRALLSPMQSGFVGKSSKEALGGCRSGARDTGRGIVANVVPCDGGYHRVAIITLWLLK